MGGAGESSMRPGGQTDDYDDFEKVAAPGAAPSVPRISSPDAAMTTDTSHLDHHGLSGFDPDEEISGVAIETAEETLDEGDVDDETASGHLVVVNVKRIEAQEAQKYGPRPRQNKTDAWKWSENFQDFVQKGDDDRILRYTVFQRPGDNLGLRDPNEEDLSDASSVGAVSEGSASDSGSDGAGLAGPRLTKAAKRRKLKKLAKERNRREATAGPGEAADQEPGSTQDEDEDSDDPGYQSCTEGPEDYRDSASTAGGISQGDVRQPRLPPMAPQHRAGVPPEMRQSLPIRGAPGLGSTRPSVVLASAAPPPGGTSFRSEFAAPSNRPRPPPAGAGDRSSPPPAVGAIHDGPGRRVSPPNDQQLPVYPGRTIAGQPTPPPSAGPRLVPGPPCFIKPPAPYDALLDSGFDYVDSPRRFFQVGRIFMTVWFEAESLVPARTQSSVQWHLDCPAFRGTKPYAAFRWFVVVRKKTTHSLCLSIHTRVLEGPLSYDAPQCVLHSSLVEPPEPSDDERIVPEPIPVVVEHKSKFISPLARLDLSRIYTVEHNLKVMKLGYVPKSALGILEKHYRTAVNV
ncbi:hypothetical protein GQ53DRAFT_771014 [Thozetella sp. PMI_491]|nr:hypothetical protein GQ53DRAFT_771014 [Thozetella sp. PMI_491]